MTRSSDRQRWEFHGRVRHPANGTEYYQWMRSDVPQKCVQSVDDYRAKTVGSLVDAARRRAALPRPVPTRCPDCRRRVRKASQRVSEWPGTVAMMDAEGHCSTCKKRKQLATIAAAAPPKTPARQLVDAVTPPPPPKVAPPAAPALVDVAAQLVEQLEPEEPTAKRKPASTLTCIEPGCIETVSKNSRMGLCAAHRRTRAQAARDLKTPDDDVHRRLPTDDELTPDALKVKRSLDAYWANRRRRGVPARGLGHDLAETG